MDITLNGELTQVTSGHTLSQLATSLGLQGKRYAIEVNQEIVPRSEHDHYQVQAGDKIEIVTAIGGG